MNPRSVATSHFGERARELLRQQTLLRALWRDVDAADDWLRGGGAARGLAAYRANAGTAAERALGHAFPTVVQLVGSESFAALARAFWHRHPPTQGDLALWGEALPGFIAADGQLATEPYLADVARLDWALHLAQSAADEDAVDVQALQRLADTEPARLQLRLRAGSALIESHWPVATIHAAHHDAGADTGTDTGAGDRFAPVRAAFANLADGKGENVLVCREGWRALLHRLGDAEARFTAALLARRSLDDALTAAASGAVEFDFQAWLLRALQGGWLVALEAVDTDQASPPRLDPPRLAR